MRHWLLNEIETPDGSRSPAVLHSLEGESRVVLIGLEPGQDLGDHQVKESAFLLVVDGRVRVDAGDESIDAEAGELFRFDPGERHSVTADGRARLLLMLAPWPGEGHYRGDEPSRADVSASS
jgi:quercetin dioxygenase-like cupin family protein